MNDERLRREGRLQGQERGTEWEVDRMFLGRSVEEREEGGKEEGRSVEGGGKVRAAV